MVLDVVQYGNPVLRMKCAEVVEVTDEIWKLAEDMIETMVDEHGVGLAAPQVGRALRMAVVDVSHDPECISYLRVNGKEAKLEDISPVVFINPQLELHGAVEASEEGCLSIQEIRAKVKRPSEIKAMLPQLDGSVLEVETDGLFARAIQHEVDHLNGVLFTDRVSTTLKTRLRKKLKDLAKVKWERQRG